MNLIIGLKNIILEKFWAPPGPKFLKFMYFRNIIFKYYKTIF